MLEHETEAPKASAAAHEVGQHLVRDRFFGDETVPGEFGEARRTGRMLGGLDGERRVADDPDERRDDHELEQAEVVDLGDLQLTHAVEQRRARAAPLQREQLLEHHALAVVTIAKPALGEQALVALEGVGQPLDARARYPPLPSPDASARAAARRSPAVSAALLNWRMSPSTWSALPSALTRASPIASSAASRSCNSSSSAPRGPNSRQSRSISCGKVMIG